MTAPILTSLLTDDANTALHWFETHATPTGRTTRTTTDLRKALNWNKTRTDDATHLLTTLGLIDTGTGGTNLPHLTNGGQPLTQDTP